jgi:hypothetical protein
MGQSSTIVLSGSGGPLLDYPTTPGRLICQAVRRFSQDVVVPVRRCAGRPRAGVPRSCRRGADRVGVAGFAELGEKVSGSA